MLGGGGGGGGGGDMACLWIDISVKFISLDSMQSNQWRPCQETRHNCRSEMV